MRVKQPARRSVLKAMAATAAAGATSIAMPRIGRAASQKLTVGKSIATLLAYTPIDFGLANNFYQKRGLELEVVSFNGAARMHQAMVSGAIDIALGSGAAMANIGKGEPSLAIAQTLGPPADIAIVVPYDSPIKTVDDMRGKVTGVASTGSVTEWMVFELARQKGWPLSDMKTVGIGGTEAAVAAIRAKQVDALVVDVAIGLFLEPQKAGRVLIPCSAYVKDFVMHANFASTKIMNEHPQAVSAFCAGWFEAIELMQHDKAQAVRIATPITKLDQSIVAASYDLVVPKMSRDGHFDPKGLETLARSYVETKALPTKPDMSKFYTQKFLPKSA
ncbi:MAG TPA: ABC transporter substrate-binding protein [Stellaceae bacterium]|nr:ABC transporter substrate-binding protein [Stellaceae bacterium]